MRNLSGIVLLAALAAAAPASADVLADQVTGEVVSARGRWTSDGLIVTDAVIRGDDGVERAVVQLGGRVDGYGQRMFPGAEPLETGTRVTVRVAPGQMVADVAVLTPPTFVRTGPTKDGHYLYWAGGCVFLNPDTTGTDDIDGNGELAVIDRVIDTWNDAVAAGSYIRFENGGSLPVTGTGVGRDGANRIIFRDDRWCRPAVGARAEFCLPRGAAGLTTVTYVDDASSSRDGEIVDADVELNGEEFAISENGVSNGDASCLSDLANTLTHELGHVLGFDHTCLVPSDPPKFDDQGNEVPFCTATSDPKITEATMYNFQDCGETKKQSPSEVDIQGVSGVYPTDEDPGVCEPVGVEGGCCSSGRGGNGALAVPLLFTAISLLWASRRRGRSRG